MGPTSMGDSTVNLLSVLPPSNPSMHKKAGNLWKAWILVLWPVIGSRTAHGPSPDRLRRASHAHSTRLPNCVDAVTYSSIT